MIQTPSGTTFGSTSKPPLSQTKQREELHNSSPQGDGDTIFFHQRRMSQRRHFFTSAEKPGHLLDAKGLFPW